MLKGKVIYENTVIYKLKHNEDFNNEYIYIGSTTNFIKRKYDHKYRCNNSRTNEHNHKKYKYIRNNGGWDMWNMILIEKYPCADKREAERREREWIDFYKSKLNTNLPFLTNNYVDLKEYQKEYQKNYREVNKKKSKKKRCEEENKQYF